MPEAFQPGEIVVLKSKEGSYITIEIIFEKSKDARVVYRDGHEMKHETINTSALEKKANGLYRRNT